MLFARGLVPLLPRLLNEWSVQVSMGMVVSAKTDSCLRYCTEAPSVHGVSTSPPLVRPGHGALPRSIRAKADELALPNALISRLQRVAA